MSTDNVTPICAPLPVEELARYFAVPGFDTVIVTYYRYEDAIEYAGTPEAQLASSAVTADMLAISKTSGPRIRRKDADGYSWRVIRTFRRASEESAPYAWYRVTRPVKERLSSLPFGWKTFAAYKIWQQWEQEQARTLNRYDRSR